MTPKTYEPKLTLHWQEEQGGYDYYGGFLGFFKNKKRKGNSYHSKVIDKETAEFIVKTFPRHYISPMTVLTNDEYGGEFYCKGKTNMYIEKSMPNEARRWINKVLEP